MWKKKQNSWGMAILLLLLFVAAGYYISGLFMYPEVNMNNFQEYLVEIITHPFQPYYNAKTRGCITLAILLWMFLMIYIQQYYRNFLPGREYGSADWASIKEVMNQIGDPQGRILSQHITVSHAADKISNNNVLVVGAPGTGKSFRLVGPNLLKTNASVVVLDVKGDLLRKYGNAMEKNGYQVKAIDLISSDFGKSHCFNPFSYIKTEVDLIRIVNTVQNSLTTVPEGKQSIGDPFWEDGVTLYLLACFYYVWMEMENPTLPKVQILMNEESRVLDEEIGETELGRKMELLAQKSPMGNNHPAVINYRKLKEGAPDTVRSIIIMCNAKFKFAGVAAARRLFSDDELQLEEMGIGKNGDGKTRTVLFICVPDQDRSFDFVVAMIYDVLFQTIVQEAQRCGGSLPIPVEIWMDEYANGQRPKNFTSLITTLRSRNCSVIMFLQSVSQLKTIHGSDSWEILFDACATFIYLGSGRGSTSTHKAIADMLGSATIDKKNDGITKGGHNNNTLNFDKQGRELLNSEEVARIPRNDCIIFLEGQRPIYDQKYKTEQMKEFKEAMKLGDYVSPVQVKKTKEGEYITIKAPGELIPITQESVEYYRKRAENGEKIGFYDISEEEFLQMDFSEGGPEITPEILHQLQVKVPAQDTVLDPAEGDLSGSIFECLNRYYDVLTNGQKEEILLGLENGLTEKEVKSYLTLTEEEMRIQRRLLQLKKAT